MKREELIAKLEALRPEFAKILRQFGAHEPDWEPLENLLVHDFMFMGHCDGVRMYKHFLTRRYLHLDSRGRAFHWCEDHYEPIPLQQAIAAAFDGLDELLLPESTGKG